MGNNLSKATRTIYSNHSFFSSNNKGIFIQPHDSIALMNQFTPKTLNTDLVENRVSTLPDGNFIVEMILNPILFSQYNSSLEVWENIVSKLCVFNDDDLTKFRMNEFIEYFKNKTELVFENEKQNRLERFNRKQTEYSQIEMILKENSNPKVKIDDNILEMSDYKQFIDSLPENTFLDYHQCYSDLSIRIIQKTNINNALDTIKWGFFASDLASILKGLFVIISSNDTKGMIPPQTNYLNVLYNLSLVNSAVSPSNKIFGNINLKKFSFDEISSKSVSCCDGRNLYLLGNHLTMSIISLSNNISNDENRFHSFHPRMKSTKLLFGCFMTNSNGFLLISDKKMKNSFIYSIPSLTLKTENPSYSSIHSPKIKFPLASDGKFIYSLVRKKKIGVFSLTGESIIYHYTIELKEGNNNLNSEYPNLIPSSWTDKAYMYTNGTVLSFLIFKNFSNNLYTYFVRHFSLVSGMHICDNNFVLRWPIDSVTFDPWNQCLWVVSQSKDNSSLIKITSNGSLPLWLTGMSQSELLQSKKDLSFDKKSLLSFAETMYRIVSYYGMHFIGLSRAYCLSNARGSFSKETTYLFVSCNDSIINILIESIHYFIKQNKNDGKQLFIIQGLLSLMQCNLFNNFQGYCPDITENIIDLLISILKDETYNKIHKLCIYIIISTFSNLFKDHLERCNSVFSLIQSIVDKEYFIFILNQIQKNQIFPYCFCRKNFKDIIEPMLMSFSTNPPTVTIDEIDFISTLQFNMMYEINCIFADNVLSLPKEKEELQEVFFQYAEMMIEIMNNFISNNLFKNAMFLSPFIKLFKKWLIMLHPLSLFVRISSRLIGPVSKLFKSFDKIFEEKKISLNAILNPKLNDQLSVLFFEFFSIYLELIFVLTDGGAEMQDACNYIWLIDFTIKSKLNLDTIKNSSNILNQDMNSQDRIDLINKKIISNIPNLTNQSKNIMYSIISNSFLPEENNDVKNLFEYLYSLVKVNAIQKKVFLNEKQIEKIIILAFAKHIGIIDEISDIMEKLNKNQEPIVSNNVKQLIDCIYKVRREIKVSKQLTIHFQGKINESTNNQPTLNQDYPKFLQAIREKCILLLLIKPSDLKKDENEISKMLKKLSSFILSQYDTEQCFTMISNTELVNKNISTSLELTIKTLQSKVGDFFNSFILKNFFKTNSLIHFISGFTIEINQNNNETFKNLNNLMEYLCSKISKTKDNSLLNIIINFYLSFALAIGKININNFYNLITSLIQQLFQCKESFSENIFLSYITLISSCFYSLIIEQPSQSKTIGFNNIKKVLFSTNDIIPEKLPILRLFLNSGIKLPYSTKDILDFLQKCNPENFHSAILFLSDAIKAPNEKHDVYKWILKKVGLIASGIQTSFFANRKCLSEYNNEIEQLYKTPGILLNICNQLIQICRQSLNKHDPVIVELISEILQGKDTNLLYEVFPIFSNLIDTFNCQSMIKDCNSNIVYYVVDIDLQRNLYIGWKIPVTEQSKTQEIPITENIIPISSIPFKPYIFPNYDLLLPYFLNTFQKKQYEIIDYYILESLLIYLDENECLEAFLNSGIDFSLDSITLVNSSSDFSNLLKKHLFKASDGFTQIPTTSLKMMHCSIPIISDKNNYQINTNNIIVENGFHCFVSSILNQFQTTYIEFNIEQCQGECYLGVHGISNYSPSSSTYLYDVKNKSIIYNSYIQLEVPQNSTKIIVMYNPIKSKGSFYINNKKIHSLVLPNRSACFILYAFDKTKIRYQISNIPIKSGRINPNTAKQICPLYGKTKFMREKHITSLKSALRNIKIISTPKIKFDNANFTSSFVYIEEKTHNYFESQLSFLSFISFQPSVVTSCGKSLNINNDKELSKIQPFFPPLKYNGISNTSLDTKFPVFYEKGCNKILYNTFDSDKRTKSINDITGQDEKLNEHKPFNKIMSIIPLHHRNYSELPTDIINYFTNGLIYRQKNRIINTVFINSIASMKQKINQILKIFSMTTEKLLQYSIHLLLYIEPISFYSINLKNSPIKLEKNIFENDNSKTMFRVRDAVKNIFEYFKNNDMTIKIIDYWFDFLIHQFSDIKNHFVKDSNKDAIIIPLNQIKEGKSIFIPGASSIIVFRTGFSNDTPDLVSIISNSLTYNVSSNIVYVPFNRLKILISDKLPKENPLINHANIAVLPIYTNSNETLVDTFFELAISLKYFVLYFSKNINLMSQEKARLIRCKIYQLFIDSFISESPYFISFCDDLLDFFVEKIPLIGSDLVDDLPMKLSLLSIYSKQGKDSKISKFLEEQQLAWNERVLLPLKSFFPEFLTESDKKEINEIKTEKVWGLPSPPFPSTLSLSDLPETSNNIKRLLKKYDSIRGYPFYLLLHLWGIYTMKYPPFTVTYLGESKVEIKFKYYIPQKSLLAISSGEVPFKCSLQKDMNDYSSNTILYSENGIIYLESDSIKWRNINFCIVSNDVISIDKFVFTYREKVFSDVEELIFKWDIKNDSKLLDNISYEEFTSSSLSTIIETNVLLKSKLKVQYNILGLRTTLITILSWLLYYNSFTFNNSLNHLINSIPFDFKVKRLRDLVEMNSNDDDPIDLRIDRRNLLEIRSGSSSRLEESIICQLSKIYDNCDAPYRFRRKGEKPWRVCFTGESGIDVGGPARELVYEASIDVITPECGLFIKVPNARNNIGENREYIIPISKPGFEKAKKCYKFVGVLLGICIRTSIVQDFSFAPFVWNYLGNEEVKIEDIYEIDFNFKKLMNDLQDALNDEISELDFDKQFNNLRFVVEDSSGSEIPLIERGRLEKVTLNNCSKYISLAKAYRLNEMKNNLEQIKSGLWENLNFPINGFISGSILEYAACGSKDISFEDLNSIVKFNDVPIQQQHYFTEVIRNFTSEQRSKLLKFATGRVRLPPKNSAHICFEVDHSFQFDKMPQSSTCFNQLHLPTYSSYENAYKMISLAIEYSGTFENK